MNDAQNGNGKLPDTMTLSQTDKLVICKLDETTKTVIVSGLNVEESDVIDIMWVALAQAINTLKEKVKSNPPGRIITLPPGSRLRNG